MIDSRKTAWVLLLALFASYLALSPGFIVNRGYIGEEMNSGMQMLASFNAWVKGRPVPPMVWSRHGAVPVLFDLPFLKLGKFFISPEFVLSIQPVLVTAGIGTVLFLWLRTVCSPGMSLLLTLTAAFGTMLWPYAYIGLETKQSFFVLLAGYLGLACGKIRTWPRVLFFAAVCGFALSVKSVGVIVTPAIAYLVYIQFKDDWRMRRTQALAVIFLIGGFCAASVITRNFYWTPIGGAALHLSLWWIESPLEYFINLLGMFGSPTKGLFLFAPVLFMCLWAVPQALRTQPRTTIFALLVTGCTVAFLSMLTAPADEVWGPRFMHIVVAPLLLCIGMAWPRFQWQRHVPVVVLATVGLVVSFLGALYYYGGRHHAGVVASQNTIEWLTGDRTWNEVTFNARLFRIWLRGGTDPVPWIPSHTWLWSRPPDAPVEKTVDLREYCEPQSFLLLYWNKPVAGNDLAMFQIYLLSSSVGLLSMMWVLWRTMNVGKGIDLGSLPRLNDPGVIAAAGAALAVGAMLALGWMIRAPAAGDSQLVLSKTEVVAGRDFYVLSIMDMPNSKVKIRYSIDNEDAAEFTAFLDGKGQARFDVSSGTRKGTYRMLAYSKSNTLAWIQTPVVLTVK